MWDTVDAVAPRLSHDMPCQRCDHPSHPFMSCSDTCDCGPTTLSAETTPVAAPTRQRFVKVTRVR
jgi:hypothetical protein